MSIAEPGESNLFEQYTPSICAVCPLNGQRLEGGSICPTTARRAIELVVSATFNAIADGASDDEPVRVVTFGDTVKYRTTVEDEVAKVRKGLEGAIVILDNEATRCASTIGRSVLAGHGGLVPATTYTEVDISRLVLRK